MTKAELQSMIENTAGKAVADAIARMAQRQGDGVITPVIAGIAGDENHSVHAIERSLFGVHKGLELAGAILCLAEARGDYDRAVEASKKAYWKGMPGVEKVLTAGEATNGGVLVSPEHSQDLIDLLAPRTFVRKHITDVTDVSAGMVDMPRLSVDAATSWGGEIEQISQGQPGFDQLVMRAFQHKVIVPVSNTLLRRGGARVASTVRTSTLRSMAIGEDRVFITSPGTEHRPKGLRFWPPDDAAHRLHAQSNFSLTTVNQDLGQMLLGLEEGNVPMTHPAWFFAPRTKNYLMTLQTTTGAYAFRDEMVKGTLWGIPFESTTFIARNEGTGANESVIYLFDADEFTLGQGQNIQIDLSDQATIVDENGNVISAYQRNMTFLRVINEVDLKPKHNEAIVTMDQVKWAPV